MIHIVAVTRTCIGGNCASVNAKHMNYNQHFRGNVSVDADEGILN